MGTPTLTGDTATETPWSHPPRGPPTLGGSLCCRGGSVCPHACPPPLVSPGSPGHSASAGGMLSTPIKDRGSGRGQGVLTWGCCPPAPPRGWLRPDRVTRDSRTRLFLFPTPGSSGRSADSRCSGRTMGVPAASLLLLLLLLLVAPTLLVSPCFPSLLDISQELDLTNRSSGCSELDWSPFQGHRRVLLRHNGIEALSPSARLGPRLEELDLAENRLRELPDGFFTNATALRSLRLEGNPLPTVPPAAFQPTLRSLSVSCRCDVLATVLAPCARGGILCLCLTSHRHPFNVTEFHGRECGSGAGLVAGLVAGAVGVVAAMVVAALVAAVWYRRRRAGAAVGSGGRGKQDPAGTLRQPRYISRDTGSGSADVTDGPDYENVFVSPGTAPAAAQGWAPAWQEPRYSPQVPLHEDYFLESAADPGFQPIYANTLGPTEDIYITPDQ